MFLVLIVQNLTFIYWYLMEVGISVMTLALILWRVWPHYPIFLNQRQESISLKKKGKKKQESLKNIILKKLAKLYQYIGNQEKCIRTYHRVEKFTSSINLKNVLTYQTFMMFMISHMKFFLWFSWSYSSAFVLLGFFLIHDYVLGASKTLHLPPLSIKCT